MYTMQKNFKHDFESIPTKEKSFIFKHGYRKPDGSYLLPCDEIIYLNSLSLSYSESFF